MFKSHLYKKNFLVFIICFVTVVCAVQTYGQYVKADKPTFIVKGFHLDLRIQVMTMPALKNFALNLSKGGINTLVMEWEATYPFKNQPLIPNRYAYTREEIKQFIAYCTSIGIDVIPLQQSFGHVEYILRNYKYAALREDQKDYSQVCPVEETLNKELFTDLYTDLASTHTSKYIHIGGDETYLLGHCEKCKKRIETRGKSGLYIDYIKMLCDIVVKLGKVPVLWADIALKYPEDIHLLPKQTVFVDWNYGWDLNMFGKHEKLMESGYEIWGAPAIRSNPDNYFLTCWQKHLNNIHDFVPLAQKLGYKGIVMTSWSTSGIYSPVFESSNDIVDLYAVRHVYPITGFNMITAAYLESIKTDKALNTEAFIKQYAIYNYGFDKNQASSFWNALTSAPYEVKNGKVVGKDITVAQLLDSAQNAAAILKQLVPPKNKKEFRHYQLMADIRVQYLSYMAIETEANSNGFTLDKVAGAVLKLKQLKTADLDKRFIELNETALYPAELKEENGLRDIKIDLLLKRLQRIKN